MMVNGVLKMVIGVVFQLTAKKKEHSLKKASLIQKKKIVCTYFFLKTYLFLKTKNNLIFEK